MTLAEPLEWINGNPAQDSNHLTKPPESRLEVSCSRRVTEWLAETKSSLAFSTYQAGKLFLLGRRSDNRLSVFERTIERCLGLWSDGQTLWMSSQHQIWRFENMPKPSAITDGYDRLFVPQVGYTTGDFDVHDMAIDANGRPGPTVATTQAFVQGVGLVNGTLYLIGTDGRDHVQVRYDSRHDEIDVVMMLDLQGHGRRGCHGHHGRHHNVHIRQSFDAASIDRIVVFLGEGDDFYDGEVGNDRGCRRGNHRQDAISQIVFGGSGDDEIFTGIGNDFVDGGSGRDNIHSDDGSDILIGGLGRDQVKGGRGNDLLIGGSLATDWEHPLIWTRSTTHWLNGRLVIWPTRCRSSATCSTTTNATTCSATTAMMTTMTATATAATMATTLTSPDVTTVPIADPANPGYASPQRSRGCRPGSVIPAT